MKQVFKIHPSLSYKQLDSTSLKEEWIVKCKNQDYSVSRKVIELINIVKNNGVIGLKQKINKGLIKKSIKLMLIFVFMAVMFFMQLVMIFKSYTSR